VHFAFHLGLFPPPGISIVFALSQTLLCPGAFNHHSLHNTLILLITNKGSRNMKNRIKLTYWEGYISMLSFLEKILDCKHKNRDLQRLLISMNPSNYHDNVPLERTMLLDWLSVFNGCDLLREKVDIVECYKCMLQYMEKESEKCGYDLADFKKMLEVAYSKKKNNRMWTLWIDSCLISKI
jgi:hypothetical protein